MDTARAKSIIIILFVALNIFLLVNILLLVTGNNISAETLENTRVILSERGVTLADGVKIPVYRKEIPPVIFGEDGADRAKVEAALLGAGGEAGADGEAGDGGVEGAGSSGGSGTGSVEGVGSSGGSGTGSAKASIKYEGDYYFEYEDPEAGIKISSGDGGGAAAKDVQRELKKLMERMGLPAGNYAVDRQTDSEVCFIYKEDSRCIFDNYILFGLSGGGISYAECSYREVAGFGEPAAILPAHQVLIKNIVDCDGCVISAIDLGYKSMAPVWRICFTDDTCQYYGAE